MGPETGVHVNGKGTSVMEVGHDGDVPGAAGLGACGKTTRLVDATANDHFDGLLGNPGGRRRVCRGSTP